MSVCRSRTCLANKNMFVDGAARAAHRVVVGLCLSLPVSLPVSEVLNTKKHARVFARMVVFDRHVHVRH